MLVASGDPPDPDQAGFAGTICTVQVCKARDPDPSRSMPLPRLMVPCRSGSVRGVKGLAQQVQPEPDEARSQNDQQKPPYPYGKSYGLPITEKRRHVAIESALRSLDEMRGSDQNQPKQDQTSPHHHHPGGHARSLPQRSMPIPRPPGSVPIGERPRR